VELGLVHTLFMLCYNSIYWVYFTWMWIIHTVHLLNIIAWTWNTRFRCFSEFFWEFK